MRNTQRNRYPDMRGAQPEEDRAYFSLVINKIFFFGIFDTETFLMPAVKPTPPELSLRSFMAPVT